ncbi:major tail protein [Virgibacillus litoralis]|uniref:Phi13 family phage major tail protein n=1 Tax=Virgibacillus litoralis TaxID=578221 RepID=A0ABS4HIR7_9BACI|nr:major tail protein [Virgibacillus litoralis]MBP1950297.1 phi13 family phage major tail protein [Virgibacillus litoralis]
MGYENGLKNFHYAILTDDSDSGATYDTPVKLAEAVTAGVEPSIATGRLYGDNKVVSNASKFNYATVTITTTKLPAKDEAALLGKTLGSDGVLRSRGNAPYVAFGYEVTLDDGTSEFWWILKGKFQEPSRTKNTGTDSIEYGQPSIVGEFIRRDFDEEWKFTGNEGNAGFETVTADDWFNSVYEPNPDTTAPTVTTAPDDDATAVAITTDVIWTFDEAIRSADVNDGNFYLMDSLGTVVDGSLTQSTDETTVTFTPTTDLNSAMDYTAVASKNIRDLAGNNLANTEVTNFATS